MTVSVYHDSEPINISGVDAHLHSYLEWASSEPPTSSFQVQAQYDGTGPWFNCLNRFSLPSLSPSANTVVFRKTFTALDGPRIECFSPSSATDRTIVTEQVSIQASTIVEIRIDCKPTNWSDVSSTNRIATGPSGRVQCSNDKIRVQLDDGATIPFWQASVSNLGIDVYSRVQIRAVMNLVTEQTVFYTRQNTYILDLEDDRFWTQAFTDTAATSLTNNSRPALLNSQTRLLSGSASTNFFNGDFHELLILDVDNDEVNLHVKATDFSSVEDGSETICTSGHSIAVVN